LKWKEVPQIDTEEAKERIFGERLDRRIAGIERLPNLYFGRPLEKVPKPAL